MAIISKKTLEDIRFRNDIADVIGSHFNIQRAGSAFKALCPFHKEKTPSFHVNPQRQIFHCFGCGAGGDVFKFIMLYEGVDFATAARMLAERAGIPLQLEKGETPGPDKTVLYKILADVAALYHRELLENKAAAVARQYLAKRDLGKEIVNDFLIGYSPDSWDYILNWGRKNKHAIAQLEAVGMVLKKAESSGSSSSDYYDRFRNRLMFPIRDEQGRVIGFSARTLDEADKSAKYINTPETPLFHKSRVLYALDTARRNIVDSREAIVCEGQIDVIRCHTAGFNTAVASQGTAFTEEHIHILRRYADSAVLVFDPDKAGQDAAVRTAAVFMDAGLAVRVALLPKGEDPDLFIRKNGADAFRQVLDKAMSVVAFQIHVFSSRENAKSEIGTMRIAKAVLQTIAHSPNAVQKAKLVQEAAQRLNLPASALQEDLRQLLSKMRQPAGPGRDQAAAPAPVQRPKEEMELCEHIVHVTDLPEMGSIVGKHLPLDMVTDPYCRALVKASLESQKTGRDIQDILREQDDPSGELQTFLARVLMAPAKAVHKEYSRVDAVKDIILYIWRKKIERERNDLQKRLQANSEKKDEERCRQLTCDLNSLKRGWEDGSVIIQMELGK